MATVTVIIPCHNHGECLTEAIQSVVDQTFQDWECLVIDDGSTDDTKARARSWAGRDSRIKYVEQPHRGLSATRNRGLDLARGKYIQFLDADDLIREQKLELQIGALGKCVELAIAYCDYEVRREERTAATKNYFSPKLDPSRPVYDLARRWETELSIPIHCFLFDARLFKTHGIRFDQRLPNHEDWDCWMTVLALQPAMLYIDQRAAIYRDFPKSMCTDLSGMRRGFIRALTKQIRLQRDPELKAILRDKMVSIKASYRERRPVSAARVAWNGFHRYLERHILWRFHDPKPQ